MQRRSSWWFVSMIVPILLACLLFVAFGKPTTAAPTLPLNEANSALASVQGGATYTNPLPITIPETITDVSGMVESCADPSVIRSQTEGDDYWYMYCTTDPLNGADRNEDDTNFNFRLIPMLRSLDLVNWEYMGDAFTERPSYADPTAGLWAPEIDYFDGQYYLYFGVTDVISPASTEPDDCHNDNAIGVATSDSPAGPWTATDEPVVYPRSNGPCNYFWTFDPEVIEDEGGQKYIYYGSYYGGVHVRELSDDGLTSDPATATQVAIANKFEGQELWYHDGFYYIFLSATDCCRGPLTGYSIFVGRSASPTGPFVDKDGVPLTEFTDPDEGLSGRAGGTPALSLNGNRWVGPGHNTVFSDTTGQVWTIYHAIDNTDPYFTNATGFTKRPALLDPVDWVEGWPTVRGGYWASDEEMPAPAAQEGDSSNYVTETIPDDEPGLLLPEYSDEFSGTLGSQWSWVREPMSDTYGVVSDTFQFDTQAADLFEGSNNASVLVQDAPLEDYMVETRVRLSVPAGGCCFNYAQAGLVIYGDDDNFIKLVSVSIWETRQTEFAKEQFPVEAGFPRYGNTIVGAPGEWTDLRIVKRTMGEAEHYTAYTRMDAPGADWVRGGTWVHDLESLPGVQGGTSGAQIGLVSMAASGFVADFDYVHVYNLLEPTAVTVNTLSATPTGIQWLPLLASGLLLATGTAMLLRRRLRTR